MITCPDVGTLRTALDDDMHAESRAALDHARACATCRKELTEIETNAAFARRAFALLTESGASEPATPVLKLPGISSRPGAVAIRGLSSRLRIAAGAAAAAVVVVLAAVTPQGQAATAQFLAQFRGQRLAVVSIDPTQSRMQLSELGKFATIKGDTRRRPESVATIAEASQKAGLDVRAPDGQALPASLQSAPKASVVREQELRFSFDTTKAAEYFKSINRSDLRLPDRIDGTTLVIAMPSVVMLEYAGSSTNSLGLMVAQAGELSATTEGAASLEEVREYLLGLPNLSASTVTQLRAMSDWRTTLPIPVPVDQIQWQTTTIGGAPGYLFVNKNGPGNALLWNASGRIFGVVGDVSQAELQRVADDLR
jgi:hypothetical protein